MLLPQSWSSTFTKMPDHAKAMSNRHLKYEKDESYIKDRWHAWIAHDPAFNPNLDFKGKIVLVNPRRGKNKWD